MSNHSKIMEKKTCPICGKKLFHLDRHVVYAHKEPYDMTMGRL